MNLSSIDLNLLVVFDALMQHRHVTRAGQHLGLSQPATSNALARLRRLLEDDLFVRGGGGLQPTPKAITLAAQLKPALGQIQSALTSQTTFEPATSEMTFTLGMSDYVEFTLLPALLREMQQIAPGVSLQIRSGDRAQQLAMLDKGELDMVCGLFPEKVSWHREQRLFKETFVAVCRRGHPFIQGQLSLEDYAQVHHLLVSVKEDRRGRMDALLAKQGLRRHVAVSVPHFLVAPGVIAQTDLITTMAERVAHAFADVYHLQVLPLPLPLPTKGFKVFMRWHKSNGEVPAQCWLRDVLVSIGTQLDPQN